jgi:hypothetical protein
MRESGQPLHARLSTWYLRQPIERSSEKSVPSPQRRGARLRTPSCSSHIDVGGQKVAAAAALCRSSAVHYISVEPDHPVSPYEATSGDSWLSTFTSNSVPVSGSLALDFCEGQDFPCQTCALRSLVSPLPLSPAPRLCLAASAYSHVLSRLDPSFHVATL